jgi:perosamine synthetase
MRAVLADTTVAVMVRLLATMPDPTAAGHATALEQELAARFGVRHAVAVASGTAAVHTALRVLGIGPGDDVLVPALSVVMSAAPVVYVGARPVFVDCDTEGTDFDYADLTAKATQAAKIVMPVHLWGRVGDLDRLTRWAADHGLTVVEDACQAQGTDASGAAAGTCGRIGCFSMKDGKILWCGEGGYLFTNDDTLAAAARSVRSHGQPSLPDGYPAQVGHNYRLAEPLAVIARANLGRFDDLLSRRQHQANLLRDLVQDTRGLDVPDAPAGQHWNGYSFLATVTLPGPRAFCEHLARHGVPNSVGTFGLVPTDQRPEFATHGGPPCRNAAVVVDQTLAVLLTDRDDDQRINGYAQTIIMEARRWRHRG